VNVRDAELGDGGGEVGFHGGVFHCLCLRVLAFACACLGASDSTSSATAFE
jgi:hypothetical protein